MQCIANLQDKKVKLLYVFPPPKYSPITKMEEKIKQNVKVRMWGSSLLQMSMSISKPCLLKRTQNSSIFHCLHLCLIVLPYWCLDYTFLTDAPLSPERKYSTSKQQMDDSVIWIMYEKYVNQVWEFWIKQLIRNASWRSWLALKSVILYV